MARPACMARPLWLGALITLLLLAGCTYESPGYGGYDYGGMGGYYGDTYPYDYGYRYGRPYGYGYQYQPRYRYRDPYRQPYGYRRDYCYYHRCDWNDDDD